MTTTLTDRYVLAALRSVPDQQRADIGAELRTSIADQVEARVAQGEAPAEAERAVLLGLGDPDELAAGFTDRQLYLIGPRYFLTWWRLLRLLLAIVLPCVAFALVLARLLTESGTGVVPSIGDIVTTVLSVAVHLVVWTTVVFAVLERTQRDTGPEPSRWSLDDLPEPHESGTGMGDLASALVFGLLGGAAVVWDQLIGFVPTHPGLSFLDDSLWPWWTLALVAVLLGAAALQVMVFVARRWTYPLAAANAVLDLAVVAAALWLLGQDRLLSPEFWSTLVGTDGGEVQRVMAALTAVGVVALGGWDAVDTLRKAHAAHRVGVRVGVATGAQPAR